MIRPWERVTLKARIAQLESALRAVLAAGSGLRPDDAKRRIDEWDEIAADARQALDKEGT